MWTLRAQDGVLYLFNNKPAGKLDDVCEKEDDESEDVETEGIELSKILDQDSDQEICVSGAHYLLSPCSLYRFTVVCMKLILMYTCL